MHVEFIRTDSTDKLINDCYNYLIRKYQEEFIRKCESEQEIKKEEITKS